MFRIDHRRPHPLALLLVPPLLLAGCAESPAPVAPATPSAAAPADPLPLVVPVYTFGQTSLGNHYTCTIRSDQKLTCWGENYSGQLGGPPSNPGSVVTSTGPYTSVSASGGNFTCAIRVDESLDCWGRNDLGGVGSPSNTSPPYVSTASYPGPFIGVATGVGHTCAVRADGSVTCWGSTQYLETTVPANVTNATQISATGSQTCALQTSGVTCWGRNDSGQITGTRTPAPYYATATHSGPFAQISVGLSHVCALRSDDGNIVCWGDNRFAQVGDPASTVFPYFTNVTHTGPYLQVGAGANHTCAVRADSSVECWGWNIFGQINVPSGLTGVVDVRSGSYHSCATKSDGRMTCWGYNGAGQLNVPTVPTTHVLPTAAFSANPTSVTPGGSFTLSLNSAHVPGHPEATAFTYAFDCGTGYGAFGSSNTASCTAGGVGSQAVRGKVQDQDGDMTEYTGTMDVTDPTPPAIAPTVSGTLGSNGWYTSDVTVTWSVVDNESTIGAQSGCDPITISADTPGQTLTCSATSSGGTSSQSVTITRDATPPVLTPVVTPSPVLLNGTATATPNATDAGSGVAAASCGAVPTNAPGTSSVSCSAMDNAGNTSTVSTNYSVVYAWTGFFQPVDNLPTRNLAKAGSAIPLKFGLGGNQGLGVLAAGSPSVQQVACTPGTAEDGIEQTVPAGGSSLSYDAVAQQYVYVWKTNKAWSGSCYTLTVALIDGTTHQASFKFN